jgi:hypothetical protein
LTKHDITHSDALWEIADLLIGNNIKLNPIEAFILGAAFLLHDVCLSLIAVKDGKDGIISTPYFRDAIVGGLKNRGIDITVDTINNPPNDLYNEALFIAQDYSCEQCAQIPNTVGNAQMMIQSISYPDVDLRNYYGHLMVNCCKSWARFKNI